MPRVALQSGCVAGGRQRTREETGDTLDNHTLIITAAVAAAVVAAAIDVVVVLRRAPLPGHTTIRRLLLALAVVMPLPAAVAVALTAPTNWNHSVLLVAGPLALIVLFAFPIAFFSAITFTVLGVFKE